MDRADDTPAGVLDTRNQNTPATGHGEKLSKWGESGAKPVLLQISVKKSAEPFDPYDYGNTDGLGELGACAHIIRSTIGSGILMMPFLLKKLGCVTGTALMTAVGLVYYHNVHTLVATEYRLCQLLRVERLTFVGVVEGTFKRAPYPVNKFGVAVSVLSNFYFGVPIGTATYLLVLCANLQYLARQFGVQLDKRMATTVLAAPLIIFCLVGKILKIFVPFSCAANVLTFAMAAVVVGCSFACRNAAAAPKMLADFEFVPRGSAIFILAIRCTGIMLPLKSDMRQPRRFSAPFGSLNLAAVVVIFIYNFFALIVYANYGDEVPENILSEMPEGNLVSFLTYLFYSLALSVTFVLFFFTSYDSLWTSRLEPWLKPGAFKTIFEYCIRIGINLAAYFFAVYVPQISLMAEIAGTFGIIFEIGLLPFLQLLLLMSEKRLNWITMAKNIVFIVISAALFCISFAQCIKDMIELYS